MHVWHFANMSDENRKQLKAVESTGSLLVSTAEAMALSREPGKRAAAERWKKILERELERERKRLHAA